MNTFENLLAGLSRAEIKYILVVGLAVELCGFTRSTLDVDILVDDAPENIGLLLAALESFGEGSAKELSLDDFTPEEGCIRIVEKFPLDIFTRMGGHSYHDLLPMANQHELKDTQIQYLSAKGLILLKKDSHRPKDRIDVDELHRLLEEGETTDES